ncbi:DNA polymerase III subunit alpha [Embleya hyalina]|uniref:DNA polymerase III subunit alpha n=1 Tax=Embleya hyalina TaxID=516124 RepID=A0A401YNP0_9ACTN|nr:DNA polymerase III subunit alpha [Embleya hyalina]GCD96232.1 DNA-directed DNA polymerase [Embleya hyalina]
MNRPNRSNRPFAHLHVASGHSMRYGVSHPNTLIERAVEHGLDTLALTDRDGVYGAVAFARGCLAAGIRPILGAELAVLPAEPDPVAPARVRRTPARGGAFTDPGHPRVTVLARGKAGWAALCRLISDAHRRDRVNPVTTWEALAATDGAVVVLAGPDSEVGRALAADRPALAARLLARARAVMADDALYLELVCHLAPPGRAGSAVHAARTLTLADTHRVPAVLTNAVRYADREDAVVADVLDSARRLVPLGPHHLARTGSEAYLKPTLDMVAVAAEITCLAGRGTAAALLGAGRALADELVLDPARDLGIGSVFYPEPEVLGVPASRAGAELRARCEAGLGLRGIAPTTEALGRLDDELALIGRLGLPSYFLTVAGVVDLIRDMGVRCAARGSGAGSLVNHLLGISGVDPLRHGLLMERFVSDRRTALPDIDVDVESARRTDVYRRIMEVFGPERCACVSMAETYRARHAIRDVGAALGLAAGEIDELAKAFPHIRARDLGPALRDLPELRNHRLARDGGFDGLFALAARLDGLPRHLALHPCGVLLSNPTLLDRTPVETSAQGFPMSQFDKEDVEHLGLLKLDVLGVRMQSAMAHAVAEIERVDGAAPDLDTIAHDDPATFDLIRSTRTLGCFQIESPGQRELIGKFAPETFEDIIVDISLFRPGPVKSDMVTPFLAARQGWTEPYYIHKDFRAALAETCGVVVFHEQVIRIIHIATGCDLARADVARRALGSHERKPAVRSWLYELAAHRGYSRPVIDKIWDVLEAFASFGFCKAHAAAFALPTYQSAWLKTHHTAAFLAGVLTHDPGMYPKRLILDDARQFGVPILGVDVNRSDDVYRVEPLAEGPPGIRIPLAEVKGIGADEVAHVLAHRPYTSLVDFRARGGASRPTTERLITIGAFDAVHPAPTTRRDLLLQLADLNRLGRAGRGRGGRHQEGAELDLGLAPDIPPATGLPEFTDVERVRAELDVLGLDAGRHVLDFHAPFLADLGVTRARDLLNRRNREELLVAGVKVATQTPPIRSGRRVIFLTLDDATGPVDTTFFEDAQDPYAATLFHSWLLVVRGVLRRTGPRGVSLRATGCWELGALHDAWSVGGVPAVHELMARTRPASAAPAERRVLVHASGFKVSPYADLRPAGTAAKQPPRKLWHASPGSAG